MRFLEEHRSIGRPIPDVAFQRRQSRQGWDNGMVEGLLGETGVLVSVVMVMVMMAVDYNDHLRLRRIGDCEAEDEHEG